MGYYKNLLTCRNDDSKDTLDIMISAMKERIRDIEARMNDILKDGEHAQRLTEYSLTGLCVKSDLAACIPEDLQTVEDCFRALKVCYDTVDELRRKRDEEQGTDADIIPGQMDIREFVPYRILYGCA